MVIKDELLEEFEIATVAGGGFEVRTPTEAVDKKGKVVYKNYGYYSNVENALHGAIKHLTRRKNTDKVLTIKAYINQIKELKNDLSHILKH